VVCRHPKYANAISDNVQLQQEAVAGGMEWAGLKLKPGAEVGDNLHIGTQA
jgi:hypothetical protein